MVLIISYDIKNDKLRNRFNKFITKFGYRLQYSVYRIDNSGRYLKIIENKIKEEFEPRFTDDDSIMIMKIKDFSSVTKYGRAIHEDQSLIIVG